MKKILVLATGWHFSSHFYETMIKQQAPPGYKIDYFCIAHRSPDDPITIKEKDDIRKSYNTTSNILLTLDKILYEYPITQSDIKKLNWNFIICDNTIGDMEVFNQWSEMYDYSEYDFILITHDDNFILSDSLFWDIVHNNIFVYSPIVNSRYGSGHQFKTEQVKLDDKWMFIDNGYTEQLVKAFEPRGSFSLYKKELIDLLPSNKFDMTDRGQPILHRVGKTNSIGHDGIAGWNSAAGTFREFLYNGLPDLKLVEHTRWLSNTKRVSKYCIEGERGLLSNHKADGAQYKHDVEKILQDINYEKF